MKMYRVKHKPTGMYYQPHKHGGSDLGVRGKVYQTGRHGLSDAFKHPESIFKLYVEKDSATHKKTMNILKYNESHWNNSQLVANTIVSDWEIENI